MRDILIIAYKTTDYKVTKDLLLRTGKITDEDRVVVLKNKDCISSIYGYRFDKVFESGRAKECDNYEENIEIIKTCMLDYIEKYVYYTNTKTIEQLSNEELWTMFGFKKPETKSVFNWFEKKTNNKVHPVNYIANRWRVETKEGTEVIIKLIAENNSDVRAKYTGKIDSLETLEQVLKNFDLWQ